MKKIFSLLILLFFTTTCFAYEFGNLEINNLSKYALNYRTATIDKIVWKSALPDTIESSSESTIPLTLDTFKPDVSSLYVVYNVKCPHNQTTQVSLIINIYEHKTFFDLIDQYPYMKMRITVPDDSCVLVSSTSGNGSRNAYTDLEKNGTAHFYILNAY